jgi:radical SAM protein with 4Fe4S-binding SPASM domain
MMPFFMIPKLKHLVVKPELRCTAHCPTCQLRRDLHNQVRKQRLLTFQEWRDVLAEAHRLGVRNFDISGGEPTLYRDLPALIRLGKQYGWIVQLNSNGSLMSDSMIRALVDAGLDKVMISLYSHDAGIHDTLRGLPGLWNKATTALSQWAGQKDRHPGLEIIAQTLLCPENFLQLPDLLRLLKELGADGVLLSYLEGNFSGEPLFSLPDMERFDVQTRMELQRLCREWHWPLRLTASLRLNHLFSSRRQSLGDWAAGLYHQEQPACSIPSHMALILANGDVHPCNVVEYSHEPVVGNLFESSLTDIWQNSLWKTFREHGTSQCRSCPMLLQNFIPFRFPRWAVLRKRWATAKFAG